MRRIIDKLLTKYWWPARDSRDAVARDISEILGLVLDAVDRACDHVITQYRLEDGDPDGRCIEAVEKVRAEIRRSFEPKDRGEAEPASPNHGRGEAEPKS